MPLSQQLVDLALQTPGLDEAGDALADAVNGAYDATGSLKQPLKDALNGTWLGHALHPVLTDIPIGAWTLVLLLDALGERRGAKIAVGVGLLGAVGAALSGLTDYVDTYGKPRRLGVTHAALNGAATLFYGASFALRDRAYAPGVALSTFGYGLAALSALFGGTIALDLQIGTNHAHLTDPPAEETDACALDDVPDGGMKRVEVGGYPVLLVRRGSEVNAIGAVCAHRGGPLEEGTLEGDVVTCPWHGARYCVADGGIVSGPTAYPQPAFHVQVVAGRIRVASAEQQ